MVELYIKKASLLGKYRFVSSPGILIYSRDLSVEIPHFYRVSHSLTSYLASTTGCCLLILRSLPPYTLLNLISSEIVSL